jgi:hypothetical protein
MQQIVELQDRAVLPSFFKSPKDNNTALGSILNQLKTLKAR